MRCSKILKDMGCPSYKLRDLVNFHIKMGKTDDEIKVLMQDKVAEEKARISADWDKRKNQAMEFIWQRYRRRWPVVRKMHKSQSGTGMTDYYYSEPEGITAPAGWGFFVEGTQFVLGHINHKDESRITHAELLAHFEKTPPVVTQEEEPPVQTSTEKPPIVNTDIPEAPEKREGKTTLTRTRPDQLPFAKAVKHNCFDVCVVTGSQIHSRCSAAHLVEDKDGGADYYTNGLWLRWDIHKMMDAGECAIDPERMTLHFLPYVLEADADLRAYEGKPLSATRKPINPAFLQARWAAFQSSQ